MTRADYMRQWRQRIADGICPECGGELDRDKNGKFYSTCPGCRERHTSSTAGWRKDNPHYSKNYWEAHKEQINRRRRKHA